MRTALNSFKADSKLPLSSNVIGNIICGCMDVAYAVQENCTPAKVRAGFSNCGQCLLDFNKLMQQSFQVLSVEDIQRLKSAVNDDVEVFLLQGYLREVNLEASEIPTNSNSLRDDQPIQNQRATLLIHHEVLERHIARKNCGLNIGNMIIDCPDSATRSQLKKASAMIGRIEASERKREVERLRKAGQSVEEAKMEKELKKQEKRKRDEQRQQDIVDARLMLFKS